MSFLQQIEALRKAAPQGGDDAEAQMLKRVGMAVHGQLFDSDANMDMVAIRTQGVAGLPFAALFYVSSLAGGSPPALHSKARFDKQPVGDIGDVYISRKDVEGVRVGIVTWDSVLGVAA